MFVCIYITLFSSKVLSDYLSEFFEMWLDVKYFVCDFFVVYIFVVMQRFKI